MTTGSTPSPRALPVKGLLAALSTYFLWGVLPVYWRLVRGLGAGEKLSFRIASSAVMVLILSRPQGIKRAWAALTRSRSTMLRAGCASIVLAVNWLIYIWGIQVGQVMEASLGYYISPLLSVLLGAVCLREPLRRMQLQAAAVVTCGVSYLIWQQGQIPVFGLALASTFSLYGLLKKLAGLKGVEGFVIETILMTPVALLHLTYLFISQHMHVMEVSRTSQLLVLASGIVSSAPLVLFGIATETLSLTTLGVLQYIAPTVALVLAVFLYHEPLTPQHLVTFGCIWVGLALYAFDLSQALRAPPKVPNATR